MKFISLEVENYPVVWKEVDSALLKAEARCLYDLQQADLIRQVYFTADTKHAVIEWEAASVDQVKDLIDTFPLVQAGLIHFEMLTLVPYTGYNRLFT